MSKIHRKATCGNAGQNADCVVEVAPRSRGIVVDINSIVQQQFGQAIKKTVNQELKKYNVTCANVTITDRGAIDPVLRARVECAIKRGLGEANE